MFVFKNKNMTIKKEKIELQTEKQIEFINVTEQVDDFVEKSGVKNGQVLVFAPHTTASIVVNHDEPMLLQDLMRILFKFAPIDERYSHDMFELTKGKKSDGRSNAHSHCKNVILGCSVTVPLENGQMQLGEKQNIFFVELDGARKRDFVVQVMGE